MNYKICCFENLDELALTLNNRNKFKKMKMELFLCGTEGVIKFKSFKV